MKQKKKERDICLWAVLFWLILWEMASIVIDSNIILVSPIKVIERLLQLIFENNFWKSVSFSFLRITGGFLLALLTGVMWAALSARFLYLKQLIKPLILVIKTIPVASFIILSLIWFSSKNLAVFISFLMVFPIIYTNTLKGIEEVDEKLLEMAELFSIPLSKKIRYIFMPQIMPYFRAGCTVALGLSWKAGIAAEVIGMPKNSIGEKLQESKVYLETTDLFAWTLVIIILSIIFEKIFIKILDKLTYRWERI